MFDAVGVYRIHVKKTKGTKSVIYLTKRSQTIEHDRKIHRKRKFSVDFLVFNMQNLMCYSQRIMRKILEEPRFPF